MTELQLYCPPDVEEAYREWGANCAPAAVAALLGRTLADTRHLFPGFDQRRYCNPTHVRLALDGAGYPHRTTIDHFPRPGRGLSFIQIVGPWDAPGVPVAAAYKATHWIAVAKPAGGDACLVYDVNAGVWLPSGTWQRHVMPRIVAATKRATGWRKRLGILLVESEGRG